MKKVVLVNPPEIKFQVTKDPMPPLGLAMLAAMLEQEKIPVSIIDGALDKLDVNTLIETLKREAPDIVGITGTTWNRFDSFETARKIKKAFPSVPVVYGGPHATFTPYDTLTHLPEIDFVVRGEGEYTFLKLIKAISSGEGIDSLNGVAFRKNGDVIVNPPAELIENLDQLPVPARHLLDIPRYNEKLFGKKSTTVMSSRGCPVECVYCSTSMLWGKSHRCRSAHLVGDEIESLIEKYGIEAVWFFDDTLTLKRSHIEGIIAEIKKRKLKFNWYGEIRVNTVDKDLLKAMKDAGCSFVSFGVESGSQKILEIIDKGIRLHQVERVIDWCNELDIKMKAFFMFGLPDETPDDAKMTIDLIKKYRSRVTFVALAGGTSILPGTKMELWAKEKGYFPVDFSWVKPYYNVQNPTIGRDPRLPTLIQPQMGYKELRELNFIASGKVFGFNRIKKRLKKYYDPREILKDIILVASMITFKYKEKFRRSRSH